MLLADGVKQEEGEEEEEVQVEKEADEATVKVEMKEEDWPGDEEFSDFPWEAEEDDQGQTFPGGSMAGEDPWHWCDGAPQFQCASEPAQHQQDAEAEAR